MSTELGLQAEELAAQHLKSLGMSIVERNWRNRWCEIDIVAQDANGIHFVEVKYRRSASFGSSLDYITTNKISRLRRAAAAWMAWHNSQGTYQIDVITVDGDLAKPKLRYLAHAVTD